MKRIAPILLIIVLLTSGCRPLYKTAPHPEVNNEEGQNSIYKPESIGIQTHVDSGDNYTITAHYPALGHAEVDTMLYNFITNREMLFNQEISELNTKNHHFNLHLEYEYAYKTDAHVSILFKESKDLGDAQIATTLFSYNFDLTTDTLLSLEDFFTGTSAHLVILSDITYNMLVSDEVLPNSVDINWVKGGLSPQEKNFTTFTFDSEKITLYFNKYQLGPAFLGAPIVTIPYETLSAYVSLEESLKRQLEQNENQIEPVPSGVVEIPSVGSSETDTDPKNSKKIALTFDLGPHPIYTPIILDTLKAADAKATFFLLGNRVSDYEAIAKRIHDEGHTIGNMTYSHPLLNRLSKNDILDQVNRAQNYIARYSGAVPKLIRPPFGALGDDFLEVVNMPVILWSIDAQDLLYNDSEFLVSYIMDHAFDGAIVRLHDNSSSTTQAIAPLIEDLRQAGYELVTVDKLLHLNLNQNNWQIKTYYQAIQ